MTPIVASGGRRRRAAGRACAIACALAFAGGGGAEPLPSPTVDYVADVAMKVVGERPEESFEGAGKEFYAGGKRRREMQTMGRTSVLIDRPDLGVRWMLIPDGALYLEMKPEDGPVQGAPDPLRDSGLSIETQGSETRDGVVLERYRVRSAGSDGTAWLTPQHVPVRYEGTLRESGRSLRFEMQYTNLRLVSPDPAKFELPDGFTRMPGFSMPLRPEPGGVEATSPPDAAITPEEADAAQREMLETLRYLREQAERTDAPDPR